MGQFPREEGTIGARRITTERGVKNERNFLKETENNLAYHMKYPIMELRDK